MLVTFETKAFANITMFGDVAITLLKHMGHSGTVPGALKAENIPEALRRLHDALAAEESVEAAKTPPEAQEGDEEEEAVSLAHRAFPLIQLLEAASKADCDVIWHS